MKTINSMKPIWLRPKSEVKKEEYIEFYKHISRDWNEPLDKIIIKAEGSFEYTALIYIPKKSSLRFILILHINLVCSSLPKE